MAQTKRKRTRKHRGTPAGTIERAGRTGRPQTREDAKQIARRRRAERLDSPPTWKSAINRAAIAAAVFGVLVTLAFGRPVAQGDMRHVFIDPATKQKKAMPAEVREALTPLAAA